MSWSTDVGRYRGVPQRQAERIRRRDGHTCRRCGLHGHEVDHIINVKSGGLDVDENLETLCRICHRAKTQGEAKAAVAARQKALRLPPEPHPGVGRPR
jgi:5-methylcytosine-specific restriction protein A